MSYTRCPVAMLFLSGVTGRGRWDGWRGCSGRVKGGDRASSRFAGALAPRFNTFWKKEVEEESGQRRGADDQETALTRIESGEANGDLSHRTEEQTSELKSLMRISYAVLCLKKKKRQKRKKK